MSRPAAVSSSSSSSRSVIRGPPVGTKAVDPLHAFPTEKLLAYAQQHVLGFRDAVKASDYDLPLQSLRIYQFSHGQSNPTFTLQIERKDGAVLRRYVLRKKPKGKLLPSAHAIEREYRIMTALRGTLVPVPATYCLCEDDTIIGTPFFVMEYLTGRVFKDITLPGMDRSTRFAIYHSMVETLAHLHRIKPSEVGLADYAGPAGGENYIGRQVKRWSGQYAASATGPSPKMDELISKLEAGVPKKDDPDYSLTTIVHGDFRLDNLMFHPTEPRVIAVLDWELSTLGHPIADLAYCCMAYYIPQGVPNLPGLVGVNLHSKGIPTQEEYIQAYTRLVQRHGPIPLDRWNYMISMSFFRSAAILQGVYKRSTQGNASQSDQSKFFIQIIPQIVDTSLKVLTSSTQMVSDKHQESYDRIQEQQFRATLNCFNFSAEWWTLHKKLRTFIDDFIKPNEATYTFQHAELTKKHGSPWHVPPIMEDLKAKAREQGLWNLFFTKNKNHGHSLGKGLTNMEYAPLAELTGRVIWMAPEIFNCSAPDTGNMEVLANYGTAAQKEKWLKPLMNGEIRSCFAMTEPGVASSDATNIECTIERDGNEYVVNGRKHYISGACDPRCKIIILMGKTNAITASRHASQSMILVEMSTPGVKVVRPMTVFGYDDAYHGHAEMTFTNVRVPAENILLGEGRGFEIAQGRLGPGRIHHTMRLIGMAERGLEEMIRRTVTRTAFGGTLATKGAMLKDIADSRIEIDSCRLLCLQAASMMDTVGNKLAAQQIGMIKVLAPQMALAVLDRSIQAHGAKGVSQDTVLPWLWSGARSLRLADGPDEVHRENIAKLELRRAKL